MEPCSFGASPGDCHKTSYVRRTGLKRLADFSDEEMFFFGEEGRGSASMIQSNCRSAIITLRNWDQSLRKGLLNAASCLIFISDK